jgi:hypothetical protein
VIKAFSPKEIMRRFLPETFSFFKNTKVILGKWILQHVPPIVLEFSKSMEGIGPFSFPASQDISEDLVKSYSYSGDLGRIFTSNKGVVVHKWHHYIPIYERFFSKYRGKEFRFLEIGVSQGGSLKIWREYFGPEAIIFGIDIEPNCSRFDGLHGQVRIGSQIDEEFLRNVITEMGGG